MSDTDPSDLTRDALEREVRLLRADVRQLKDDFAERDDEADGFRYTIGELESELEGRSGDLVQALAALHEQAHGPTSIRFCQVEPCVSIESRYVGPAPARLVMV